MKIKPFNRFLMLGLAAQSLTIAAHAASNTYVDANPSNVWDTATANWTSPTIWVNGDDAIFASTSEAVAVTTVTAHNIDFNTTGYSLTGSTLTLNGTTPTLTAGTGISASISSILAGSAGLTKAGNGTLTLNAANTYTGTTSVNTGTLQVGAGGTTGTLGGNGAVSIAGGATLKLYRSTGYAYANAISGSGSGTLYLAGAGTGADYNGPGGNSSAFTGPITIDNARLVVGSLNGTGSGTITTINQGQYVNTAAMTIPNNFSISGNGNTAAAVGGGCGAIRIFGGNVFSGQITMTADAGISASANGSGTVSGPISGGFALAKLATGGGAGTLTLTGTNTYSGNTSIAGTLIIGGSGSLGSGNYAGNITNSGTLNYNSSASQTLGGVISGTGALTDSGSGRLTLTGANSYTGGTTVTGGILQLGDGTANGVIVGNIANTANVTFNNGSAQTYSGVISGAGGTLTKTGAGPLTLTGANSYSGGTSINDGTLQLGNGSATGTFGSGTYSVASAAKLYLNYLTAAAPTWANITGAGTLELNSAQAVNGSANWGTPALPSGFTGTLQLDKGRIDGNPSKLGGTTNVILADGSQILAYDGTAGTYTYSQNFSLNGMGWGESPNNLGALRVASLNATFSGNITLTGNSGLYLQNAGQMAVTGPISDGGSGYSLTINALGNPITLSNTGNNYGGDTIVGVGIFKLGASEVVPDGVGKGNVTVTGTLNLNTFSETINGLAGAGIVDTVAGGTQTLTVGNNDASSTFSGVLKNTSGTLALTKVGSGTLNLTGNNTYQGDTTVSGGTLNVGTTPTILGKYQIQSGGTLGVTHNTAPSLIINNVVLENGSTLSLPVGEVAALVALDVSTTGTVTIQPRNFLSTGTFPLIYHFSQTSPLPVFTLGSVPRGVVASLDVTASQTDLMVTAINPLLWKGNNGPAWDTNVTTNWTLSGTPEKFQVGDNVRFDDTATGVSPLAVTLAGDVNPTGVEFANDTKDYTLSGAGAIAGTSGLIKSGAGKLTLTNTNSYTGGTTITGGTVSFGTSGLGTSGTVTIANDATLQWNGVSTQDLSARLTIADDVTATLDTMTNTVAFATAFGGGGSGGVTKDGSGTLTFSGANTYTGTTTINAGQLNISGAISSFPSTGIANNATMRFALTGGGAGVLNYANTISGTGTFIIDTMGQTSGARLQLTGASAINNSATWNIINDGYLWFGDGSTSGTFPGSMNVNVNTTSANIAAFRLNGADGAVWNIGGLSGTGNVVNLTTNAQTLVVGNGNATSTFSGVMSGVNSLTKTGSGTLTLTGANTYTGTTQLNTGSLLVDGSLAAVSAVTVDAAAILGGSGTVNGSVAAAGSIAPGGSAVGTLTTGNTALAGTLSCQISGATSDRLIAGTLDLTGATLAVSELVPASASSYLIATYTGSRVGSFASVPSGYTVDYGTSGQILLLKTGISGYATWAAGFPGIGDPAATADPDNDGITNLMEYVIGGDPRASSTSFLPSQSIVGSNLVLSYTRSDAAVTDTTQVGQWSSDLATWHDIPPVIVNDNGSAPDAMEIRIPLTNAVNGKLFGRLDVVKP